MRSLKLKKVKISRVTNSHLLFGGAGQQAGQTAQNPVTHTLDTKYDDSCIPKTNNSRTSRIGEGVPINGNEL